MQSILYHSKSGSDAYAGPLKKQEVHRAITLHPVKNHTHLYRLHTYIQVSFIDGWWVLYSYFAKIHIMVLFILCIGSRWKMYVAIY